MNIGIDCSRIEIKQKTGTEWYSYYIIKNILNIDEENQYFLFSREKLSSEFTNFSNVKNIVLDWPIKKFWTIIKLSLSVKKYNLDLFFSPAHNLPICGSKKLITWHDLAYEYYPKYYSFLQKLSLKLGAKNLRYANAIISPSIATKNDIIKFYEINEDKIVVVPHGIDFEKYGNINDNKEVLNKFNLQNYFVYMGRLETKKNIESLIDFYDNYCCEFGSHYDLVLIGKPGYGYDKIESRINNSKFKNYIKILGYVSENEKIQILKNSSMYLNFSNFEGFGMTILEAVILKVPLLISDLEVFREINLDEVCYTNDFFKDAVKKVAKILRDEEFKNYLVEKNYKILNFYKWENSARKTIEVFNNLKYKNGKI
ncbi:MAG: glycosyltransferase family 1 protein [Patescibacteria group bacterium]|nr:glycosyltransferase family 1 protein [Patescibacteria group bacterium]